MEVYCPIDNNTGTQICSSIARAQVYPLKEEEEEEEEEEEKKKKGCFCSRELQEICYVAVACVFVQPQKKRLKRTARTHFS